MNNRLGSICLMIAFALVLLLAGCGQSEETDKTTEAETTAQEQTPQLDPQLEAKCKELGYEVEASAYGVPIVTRGYFDILGADTEFCESFSAFAIETDFEDYTYDDVRKAFQENDSIPAKYKEYISKGLDNMEKELPNLNLTVLHFNAGQIKFVEVTEEKMGGNTTLGSFNIGSKKISYNPNNTDHALSEYEEFMVDHEVLGHGSLEGACAKDDHFVYYGFMNEIMVDAGGDNMKGQTIGNSFTEGAANMIARIASEEDFTNIYNYAEEELRLIAELCQMPVDSMFNRRGMSLYQEMYDHNIDDPIGIVTQSDILLSDYRERDFDKIRDNHAISSLLESLVADAAEEKAAAGEPLDQIGEIMDNSVFGDELKLLSPFDRSEVIDRYSPSESFENVKREVGL